MRLLARSSICALLLGPAVLPSKAFAAPVNFTETFSQQSSDFPTAPGVLPGIFVGSPFLFDVGVNHIAGSFCCGAGGTPDVADSFQFIVPVGLEVTNVLGTSNTPDGGHMIISLTSGGLPLIDQDGVLNLAILLVAGMYDFTFQNFAQQGRWGVNFTVDVASPVSQVPIPAALPLFGSALGLLGSLGWRNRRRTTGKAFTA